MDRPPSTDQPTGDWLYRAEIRGIQRWILASDRLREMKGGSAIVERLTADGAEMAEQLGGQIRVKAAGRLVVQLPSEQRARAFAAHWPMWVARRAPGLELSHGLARASGGTNVQMQPVRMPELPEAGPLVARAETLDRRAAANDRPHQNPSSGMFRLTRAYDPERPLR